MQYDHQALADAIAAMVALDVLVWTPQANESVKNLRRYVHYYLARLGLTQAHYRTFLHRKRIYILRLD